MRPQPSRARWPRDATPSGAGERGIALVVAVALVLLAGGAYWVVRSQQPRRPLHLLEAYDISGSVGPDEKQRDCEVAEATHARILGANSRVMAWTFALDAWELYEGDPRDARELRPLLDTIRGTTAQLRGTSPARVLERMAAAARRAESVNADVALLFLWDGEDHRPEATRAAVQQLATLSNLKAIWVVGVPADSRGKDLRARVRETFAPLPIPLIISGPFDRGPGLEAFQRALQR